MCVDLLQKKTFFKLICGAGNEDVESVKRHVFVYSKAGCKVFDLSAKEEILASAKEGAALAGADDVHFCISLGIKGDPHISKAKINSNCIKCGNCANSCPYEAIIQPNIIDDKKCIGCGICVKKCSVNAIDMYEKDVDVKEILPKLINDGVELVELHIMGNNQNDLDYKWKIINECNPKLVSICIDRGSSGNKEVLERIKSMIQYRQPYTTIIQADGIPMSGGEDDYKTTLQAVAMAEIIQNANLPVYLTLSGGTNSKTLELCKQCGIYPNGIAIGSWARKIIKPYITKPDFWQDENLQTKAIEIAKQLVQKTV